MGIFNVLFLELILCKLLDSWETESCNLIQPLLFVSK